MPTTNTTMTTVRLPKDMYEALRRRAFESRRPVVDIIREACARWLAEADREEPLPPLSSDPLWKMVGTVPGGPIDESVAHDRDLYREEVAEPSAPYGDEKPPRKPAKKKSTKKRGRKR